MKIIIHEVQLNAIFEGSMRRKSFWVKHILGIHDHDGTSSFWTFKSAFNSSPELTKRYTNNFRDQKRFSPVHKFQRKGLELKHTLRTRDYIKTKVLNFTPILCIRRYGCYKYFVFETKYCLVCFFSRYSLPIIDAHKYLHFNEPLIHTETLRIRIYVGRQLLII